MSKVVPSKAFPLTRVAGFPTFVCLYVSDVYSSKWARGVMKKEIIKHFLIVTV